MSAASGIFAIGAIGTVTNTGIGSDIRGDIVSETGITNISLNNGAIIDSRIAVVSDLGMMRELPLGVVAPSTGGGSQENPNFEIGSITINGNARAASSATEFVAARRSGR